MGGSYFQQYQPSEKAKLELVLYTHTVTVFKFGLCTTSTKLSTDQIGI